MFLKNKTNTALAKRIFLNELQDCLYFPKYFEIETVNFCNARCIMCTIRNWNNRKNAVISNDLFSKFTDEVSNYKDWVETVCLARDGEPTLDPQVVSRVHMLKQVGIKKVTLSTNGQLLTKRRIEELIKAGLDDIMVSIDGVTKETFEIIRLRLNYETVLNNTLELIRLRNAINPKMSIRLRMVVIDENRHEVSDWLHFWGSRIAQVDKVYTMPAHTWGNQLRQESVDLVRLYADKPCVSVFSTITMHVDGKVGLCGVDYSPKNPMGDFSKQSLKEIWTGEAFNRARKLHVNGRRNEIALCRGCDLWDREYKIAEKQE